MKRILVLLPKNIDEKLIIEELDKLEVVTSHTFNARARSILKETAV